MALGYLERRGRCAKKWPTMVGYITWRETCGRVEQSVCGLDQKEVRPTAREPTKIGWLLVANPSKPRVGMKRGSGQPDSEQRLFCQDGRNWDQSQVWKKMQHLTWILLKNSMFVRGYVPWAAFLTQCPFWFLRKGGTCLQSALDRKRYRAWWGGHHLLPGVYWQLQILVVCEVVQESRPNWKWDVGTSASRRLVGIWWEEASSKSALFPQLLHRVCPAAVASGIGGRWRVLVWGDRLAAAWPQLDQSRIWSVPAPDTHSSACR